ncbi:MAG: ATP-grasp domain-containing protein [Ruminococcus sp.]|nr:ATP-grasp domain-containing protein [Ruminococcus sp.]
MKPVVLVTAVGTVAASHIVLELKKINEYYIIGADINPANQIATSADVDEFHVFPSAISDLEGYIDYVIDFCRNKKVEYYFAIIDEEVANLSAHRSIFEKNGIKLCIANDSLVEICHYKDKFNRWIADNMPQIAIKTFSSVDEIADSDYPLFVKPIEGRASIGCKMISDKNELIQYANENDLSNVIIQQCISGEIITIDLVRNSMTKQMTQVQRVELLRNSSGCGIAVEIINDETLSGICNDLMKLMDLNGVVNAEFFKTENAYKIIEVNPRFSAGTSFSCMAGCNTVLNALRIAQNKDCELGDVAPGQHFAKRYETYRLD